MRCAEFEIRLDELLDDRSVPEFDPVLTDHAEQCADCAELMAVNRLLLDAVELLPQPTLAADFPLRVVSALGRRRGTPHNRRIAWLWTAAAASAAALLLAVGVWRLIGLGSEPNATANISLAVRPLDMGIQPHDRKVGEYGVGSRTPASLPEWSAAPRGSYLRLAEDTERLAEDLAAPQMALVGQVADGLKPVTSSVKAALNALRRKLPGTDAEDARSS